MRTELTGIRPSTRKVFEPFLRFFESNPEKFAEFIAKHPPEDPELSRAVLRREGV